MLINQEQMGELGLKIGRTLPYIILERGIKAISHKLHDTVRKPIGR